MPLVKSKSPKAFKANVKAEIAAGKPQKQAVAIAYDVQRRAKKASGGAVDYDDEDYRPRRRLVSSDPRNYDSDIDYYNAIQGTNDDDEPEEDKTPSRVIKAGQRRLKQFHKASNKLAKKFVEAKSAGDEAALKKVNERWSRVALGQNLQTQAKTMPRLADKARKEWSEKIGKGKPAPFKSGGKVNW